MINKTITPAQDDTVTGVVLEGINLQLFAEEPPAGDPPADPTADPPASGETTAGDPPPADDPANPNPDKPVEKTGAPESYADYVIPEGISYDKESATAFNAVAKELNLTQEQAQKLVSHYAGNVQVAMAAQAKQTESWKAESIKIHGSEGVEQANKALLRFSSPEYIEYLQQSGQGNNPAVIAQWKNVAELIGEDKMINPNNSNKPETWASAMYGDKLK